MGTSADAGGNRKLIITLVIEAIETPADAGWLDYIKCFRRVIEVIEIPTVAGGWL